jgi:hypothetical protein
VSSSATRFLASSSEALSSHHLLGLYKHIITVIKELTKALVLLTQEEKIVTYLILGIRVRVALVTLLAVGARAMPQKPSPAK